MQKKDVQAVLTIALFYAAMQLVGITCPILFTTGVSCPGCGMSRAWLHLLQLDVAGAFAFHPLFWLPPVAAAGFLLRKRMPERVYRGGIVAVCVLFMAVYAVRLFTPEDLIVVWEPTQGFIYKLLSSVLGKYFL